MYDAKWMYKTFSFIVYPYIFYLDFYNLDGHILSVAPVAQLDRASDYGSEGLGFESLRVHLSSLMAIIGNYL